MQRELKIIILALIFTLAGCAHYSLVKPQRQAIGDLYTVETRIPWSMAKTGHMQLWTVNGPLLEAVRFINGLEDGENLLKIESKKVKLPRFRSRMTPSEVMEFFIASVKSVGKTLEMASMSAVTVEATNLRPFSFGSLPGFRFDFLFVSKEGLEREGMVVGAIHDEKLYLIVYTGAREYYYQKYEDEVESIVSSVKIGN